MGVFGELPGLGKAFWDRGAGGLNGVGEFVRSTGDLAGLDNIANVGKTDRTDKDDKSEKDKDARDAEDQEAARGEGDAERAPADVEVDADVERLNTPVTVGLNPDRPPMPPATTPPE